MKNLSRETRLAYLNELVYRKLIAGINIKINRKRKKRLHEELLYEKALSKFSGIWVGNKLVKVNVKRSIYETN